MSVATQLLLLAAERACAFVRQKNKACDMQVSAMVGDGVCLDVMPALGMRDELRLLAALTGEGFAVDKELRMWGCRYMLKPSRSGNPLLDLMNDYQVWKHAEKRRS